MDMLRMELVFVDDSRTLFLALSAAGDATEAVVARRFNWASFGGCFECPVTLLGVVECEGFINLLVAVVLLRAGVPGAGLLLLTDPAGFITRAGLTNVVLCRDF